MLLVVRFFAGPLSYAAGTPGGLFAPMLALGALWGVVFAAGFEVFLPQADSTLRDALILTGMAALFGAVVRAPLTGMVVVMEMSATTAVVIPMLAATAAAVLVAQLSGTPPVYDSLRELMLADDAARKKASENDPGPKSPGPKGSGEQDPGEKAPGAKGPGEKDSGERTRTRGIRTRRIRTTATRPPERWSSHRPRVCASRGTMSGPPDTGSVITCARNPNASSRSSGPMTSDGEPDMTIAPSFMTTSESL